MPSLTWLGQAGYAVATAEETLLIDPYLSDYVFEDIGQRRIAAPALDPETAKVDFLVATHWHQDHLDRPTCLALARRNPDLRFAGPFSVVSRLEAWGVNPARLTLLDRGSNTDLGAFAVYAEHARHDVPGWLTEDAVSLVIEVEGRRIYHSGDTEYDSRLLASRRFGPFDVGLFVINGTGGNMNALEAALLAVQLKPAIAIPCHYGMWDDIVYGAEATLDPAVFVDACTRFGGLAARSLELGETLPLTP